MAERYVLVIDDDTTFRDRVSVLLTPHKIAVIGATDLEEIQSLIEDRRPVLMILAVELRDKDGFALFRRVKKANFDFPVILTTATLPKAELSRHETQPSHAKHYLHKELSDSDLLDAIADAGRLELTSRDADAQAEPAGSADDVRESRSADLDSQVLVVRRKLSELVKRFAGPEGSDIEEQNQALTEELDASRAKFRDIAEHVDAIEREHKQKIDDIAKRLVDTQRDRDRSRDEAIGLRRRLENADSTPEELREQTDKDSDRQRREKKDLTERLVSTQRDRDRSREEAKELKGLFESLEVKHNELTEQMVAIQSRHERESAELTERLEASQKARDEARQETSEVRGLLDGVRAKL